MLRLKRLGKTVLAITCLTVGSWAILNLPVTSKQGVNYVVRTIKMPLYIKLIEFLDRDYHYKEIVSRVTQGCHSDEQKVLALFKWTCKNIRSQLPANWPIIDDHVWHIIIRGYGNDDQCADVLATLCNYAGIRAYFTWVDRVDFEQRHTFTFVWIRGKWHILDPYFGNYFKNTSGQLIAVEEIRAGQKWFVENVNQKLDKQIDYSLYFTAEALPSFSVKDVKFSKANIQSPFNRFLFELRKLRKGQKEIDKVRW